MNKTISYLRVTALLLILFHHTICMYVGWPPLAIPFDVHLPSYMGILSASAKGIGLNFFTFISGFVLYYQVHKQQTFGQFLWKKCVRIVLPCIIFAIIYWLIFPEQMISPFPAPINGTHLWFLPMIFLCIMIVAVHFYLPKPFWIVILLYAIICKSGNYIHLRTIDEFRFYFLIFYSGFGFNYLLSNTTQTINEIVSGLQLFQSKKWNVIALLLLVLASPLYVKMIKFAPSPTQIIPIVLICVCAYFFLLPLGTNLTKTDKFISLIDRNSFVMYLIHQFVINTWCTIGWNFINTISIYISIPLVYFSTVILSLIAAESYGIIKVKAKTTFMHK